MTKARTALDIWKAAKYELRPDAVYHSLRSVFYFTYPFLAFYFVAGSIAIYFSLAAVFISYIAGDKSVTIGQLIFLSCLAIISIVVVWGFRVLRRSGFLTGFDTVRDTENSETR